MAINFRVPNYAGRVPWFMYDLDNFQLITSPDIIPGDIRDSKEVALAEQPIFGLNYRPVIPSGGGNRKLSFTLPLIKRNNTVGNILLLKQVDLLRNQSAGFFGVTPSQFNPAPKVLFNWGTGSVPLVWWVKKADAVHRQPWVNQLGRPQVSDIDFELWLDETHPTYRAEEIYRQVTRFFGETLTAFDVTISALGRELSKRPY